jgi:arginase family enzyme
MPACVIVFPFDSFGNAGTGAGAKLLGDVVREIIADTEAETRPTRQDAFRGNLSVEEFDFETPAKLAAWRKTGRTAVKKALAGKDFTLWLGGNHLSVLPVYDVLGPTDVVVQFDAHLDVYSQHDVTTELSNGNFLRHIAGKGPRVVNVGNRDLFLPESERAGTFVATVTAADLAGDADQLTKTLDESLHHDGRVWIDLDVDVFDPAFCAAVHDPLPVGLAPPVFLRLLDSIWSDQVVGLSISEFDPGRDVRDMSLSLLGWLVEWVLLRVCERSSEARP